MGAGGVDVRLFHRPTAPAFLSAPLDYEVYDAPVTQSGAVRSSPPFGTVGLLECLPPEFPRRKKAGPSSRSGVVIVQQ